MTQRRPKRIFFYLDSDDILKKKRFDHKLHHWYQFLITNSAYKFIHCLKYFLLSNCTFSSSSHILLHTTTSGSCSFFLSFFLSFSFLLSFFFLSHSFFFTFFSYWFLSFFFLHLFFFFFFHRWDWARFTIIASFSVSLSSFLFVCFFNLKFLFVFWEVH